MADNQGTSENAATRPGPAAKAEEERGPKWVLMRGSSGAGVADLQAALNKKLGLKKDDAIEVDGVFGNETAEAVKVWQRENNLPANTEIDAAAAEKLGF
jgi:peptidoglycan hydrolase-like protein with peptidoglycan-binding domain